MKIAFWLTLLISFFIILFSILNEMSSVGEDREINRESIFSIYKEEVSFAFLVDRESTFYSSYSLFGDSFESESLLLRKVGHFLGYGILSVVNFTMLLNNVVWIRGIVAVGITTTIGFIDEVHQHFLLGRDGMLLDVFINASGSLFFITITVGLYYFMRWRKKLLLLYKNKNEVATTHES